MNINKKQRRLIERNVKAINTLLSSEHQLIEILYSPFMPTTARYISDFRLEQKVNAILDFIKFGRSKYDEFQLRNLVDMYGPAFGLVPNKSRPRRGRK